MLKPTLGLAALLSAVAIGYVVSDGTKAPASPAAPTPDPTQDPLYHSTPANASDRDRAAMLAWYDATDACQGGEVNLDTVCRKRDRIKARLERRGWCWEYSDWRVIRADDDWHRCSIARPTGFRPDPQLEQPEPEPTLAAAAKPQSPLEQYEAAITPIKDAAITAQIIVECGLRDGSWLKAVDDRLTDAMYGDPKIADLQRQLSNDDQDRVDAYLHQEMPAHAKFLLGSDNVNPASCDGIRDMPFIRTFDLYSTGAVPVPGS